MPVALVILALVGIAAWAASASADPTPKGRRMVLTAGGKSTETSSSRTKTSSTSSGEGLSDLECARPDGVPVHRGEPTGGGPSERSFKDAGGDYVPAMVDWVRELRDARGIVSEADDVEVMRDQIRAAIAGLGFSSAVPFAAWLDDAADRNAVYMVGRLRDIDGIDPRWLDSKYVVDRQHRDRLHSWRRAVWLAHIYRELGCL